MMKTLPRAAASIAVLLLVAGHALAQQGPTPPAPGNQVTITPLSLPWTDASYTATNTATVPSQLAATTSRVGLDFENLNAPGGATACINWTSTATVSGTGCGVGSIPVYAGGGRTWDQPGNVTPEAVSIICVSASCPLTIKVR